MRHFDAFVRWTAALLLTVLSIACGKDKTTTTEGSAITGGSWSQTETIYEGENETYIEVSAENSGSVLYDKEIRDKSRTRRTKRNV